MSVHPTEIAKPYDDQVWELWCLKLFARLYGLPGLQRYGVRGSNQEGIDLLGIDSDGKAVGIQCKLRSTEHALTEAEANSDLKRFLKFGTPLKVFAIASSHKSKKLQKWAASKCKAGFEVKFYAWGDIEDILRTDNALREELLGTPVAADGPFEGAYCDALIRQLDRMKLYALESAQAEVNDPQLTAAYVSLDLSEVQSAGSGPQLVQGSLTIAQVMDSMSAAPAAVGIEENAALGTSNLPGRPKREGRVARPGNVLLLVGEAGRGKTTLLRYIAVEVAKLRRDGPPAPGRRSSASSQVRSLAWKDRIPFYREVRRAESHQPIHNLDCLASEITEPIAHAAPPGWARRVLAARRGLVLLDGVDEVPIGQPRIKLLESIRKVIEQNQDTLFVVSSRPAAADDLRRELAALSPREAHVQPLAGAKLRDFITFWHKAVGEAARGLYIGENCARRCEQISAAAVALPGKLDDAPQIKALMATPLLAALVCAYHLDRNTLPDNRSKLMLALVNSLVHFHDTQRPGMPLWPAYSQLDEADKLALLGSIAAEMVRKLSPTIVCNPDVPGGTLAFDRHILEFMKTAAWFSKRDVPALREGLKQRTGVLHEVHRGHLDFVHNEFRDFLAARYLMPRAADAGVYADLVGAFADPDWHGLVYFAVTADRDKQPAGVSNKLVKQLLTKLEKGREARRPTTSVQRAQVAAERKQHQSLRRLAFRLGGANPPVKRALYEQLKKIRNEMLPPANREDAEIIVELGSRAIASLEYRTSLGKERRAACAYALGLIDLPGARLAMEVYAAKETSRVVIEELARNMPVTRIAHIRKLLESENEQSLMSRGVCERLVRQAAGRIYKDEMEGARELVRKLSTISIRADSELEGLFGPEGIGGDAFVAKRLMATSAAVTDSGMAFLIQGGRGLERLSSLDLSGTGVTDVTAVALAGRESALPDLTRLYLTETLITDAGVSAICESKSRLRELKVLVLWKTEITDAAVRVMACGTNRLEKLDALDLHGTRITNESAIMLAEPRSSLSTLEWLDLGRSLIGDVGAMALAAPGSSARQLSWLSLAGTDLGDAGLMSMAAPESALASLKALNCDYTKVTDDGLVGLCSKDSALRGLTRLELAGTSVTDRGIAMLAGGALDSLGSLSVAATRVTRQGMKIADSRWPGIVLE